MRNPDCPHYEECLTAAAIADKKDLECRSCTKPGAVTLIASEPVNAPAPVLCRKCNLVPVKMVRSGPGLCRKCKGEVITSGMGKAVFSKQEVEMEKEKVQGGGYT